MELVRYALVTLAVMAGFSVFRNPLKVWPNTLAGLSYFAGAGGSLLMQAWWPVLAGWIVSLALQGLCTIMMLKGAFKERVNAERAKRGLPPHQ